MNIMVFLRKSIAYLRHETTTGVQLREMDSFRGWACLSVVIFHCIKYSSLHKVGFGKGIDWLFYALLWPFKFGWLGVDLFFFLSGFLLYLRFGKAYLEDMPRPGVRSFYKRRFLRIAPAYYASIIIVLVASRTDFGGVYSLLAQVFFMHNVFSEYTTLVVPVSWSLAQEFQFYLILPFIADWFYGDRWKTGLAAVLAGVAIFKGLSLYYCTVYQAVPSIYIFPTEPPLNFLLWRMDEFAIGMAFCNVWLMSEKGLIKNYLKDNSRLAVATVGAGIALLAAMLLIPYFYGGIWSPSGLWSSIIRVPLISLSFGMIIFGTMYSGIPGKVLANPVIELVGVVSYSLYLWHVVVIQAVLREYPALNSPSHTDYPYFSGVVLSIVALALSIPASVVFYLIFERPFLKSVLSLKGLFGRSIRQTMPGSVNR